MSVPTTHLHRGTREYRQTSTALFVAGFMAFAMLYVVQGTLPAVSRDFSVRPATASLTLSFTTLPLAVAVIVAASWSDGFGRRSLLVGALLEQRAAARAQKDFATADAIRDQIASAGIEIEDTPSGPAWTLGGH